MCNFDAVIRTQRFLRPPGCKTCHYWISQSHTIVGLTIFLLCSRTSWVLSTSNPRWILSYEGMYGSFSNATTHILTSDSQHPNLPLQSINDLRCKWDFSRVKVHLVASLSGKHEQWPNVIQTGHPRLMKVIRDIGARAGPSKELHLECQVSTGNIYMDGRSTTSRVQVWVNVRRNGWKSFIILLEEQMLNTG